MIKKLYIHNYFNFFHQISSILERNESEVTLAEKDKIKIINLNYRDISSIGYINARYQYVEELYLNHNLLETLDGIE